MKLSPLARAAALDLAARLDITFQQAIGGLVLLADLDTQITTTVLRFHLSAAFGVTELAVIDEVVDRLLLAGIIDENEDQPGWWEVTLP